MLLCRFLDIILNFLFYGFEIQMFFSFGKRHLCFLLKGRSFLPEKIDFIPVLIKRSGMAWVCSERPIYNFRMFRLFLKKRKRRKNPTVKTANDCPSSQTFKFALLLTHFEKLV